MQMIREPAFPGVGRGAHLVGSFLRARARANSDPRSRTAKGTDWATQRPNQFPLHTLLRTDNELTAAVSSARSEPTVSAIIACEVSK